MSNGIINLDNKIIKIALFFVSIIFLSACSKNYTPAEKAYIKKIENYRKEKNLVMMTDPSSPFNRPEEIKFHALKYFPVNPNYLFHSKLFDYPVKDSVKIYGTKGELRKAVRYGYLKIKIKDKTYKLNVYKNLPKKGSPYFSIWFTDKTTGNETYGVGRYLEFKKENDPDYIYTIDFNLSFNPYCAYNPAYSCAVPLREDHLDVVIKAGEKKFHN